MHNRTLRSLTTAVAAAGLLAGAAGPATASAAQDARACKPSIFHPMKTTYHNLSVVKREVVSLGRVTSPVFNPYATQMRIQPTVHHSRTLGSTVSASTEVEVSGIVASARAQLGVAVESSVTTGTSVPVEVRIPPKRWGWVSAEAHRITVAGTFKQVDLICGKLFKTGPFRAALPMRKGVYGLVPKTGLQPGA